MRRLAVSIMKAELKHRVRFSVHDQIAYDNIYIIQAHKADLNMIEIKTYSRILWQKLRQRYTSVGGCTAFICLDNIEVLFQILFCVQRSAHDPECYIFCVKVPVKYIFSPLKTADAIIFSRYNK